MIKRKTCLIATIAIATTTSVFAQSTQVNEVKPFAPESEYRTWSIGVNGGVLTPWNPFGFHRDFKGSEYNLGYSAYIKKQILPGFGIQAAYMGGKVAGKNGPENSSFETKIPWSASLSANITLANVNWRHENGLIQPYLTAGGGAMTFESTFIASDGTENTAESTTKFFIPLGLGLKFGVAPGINIDLGYTMNFVKSPDFDGVNLGTNDKFSYGHVGLEFALGAKEKPFLAHSNPVAAMKRDYQASYDELAAALKAQQEENEALKAQLATDLADDDEDGVANKYDKCPGTPANTKVDGSGCPLPEAKQVVQQITVTEEDRKVVDEAIKNLEFDLGKATIRSTSFASLNRVAQLLVDKHFSLKLAGHTDNTGSMQTNMRLSKERAEAVKAYLVSKGANPSRIEATGYGPTQPIASNATAEGRQANRRVEFTLY
ncbi:hypothetical protein GCM10023231_05960 [Olivibacter ginsenosidimutans]|uniref:OmpA-like domain-containing protein n=1 Tax=Olivibacter ginsenosidimutans TaxID=1176537 RepID=A0ABP9AHP1_9SPHI